MGEPVQIIARQICNDRPLMLAKGHFTSNEQVEVVRAHESELCPSGDFSASNEGSCKSRLKLKVLYQYKEIVDLCHDNFSAKAAVEST